MSEVEKVEKKCNHPGCIGAVISGRCDTCNKVPWGGSRKGAGMPKGKVTQKKLEQQEELQRLQQRIIRHADELLEAQLKLALGKKVYLVRSKEYDEHGNIKRIYHKILEDPDTITKYIDGDLDGEITCVTIKSPDIRAIESLFNRAFGKVPATSETAGGFFSQPELTVKFASAYEPLPFNLYGTIIS